MKRLLILIQFVLLFCAYPAWVYPNSEVTSFQSEIVGIDIDNTCMPILRVRASFVCSAACLCQEWCSYDISVTSLGSSQLTPFSSSMESSGFVCWEENPVTLTEDYLVPPSVQVDIKAELKHICNGVTTDLDKAEDHL